MSKTLFVRGIPAEATNEQLETFCSDIGPIKSCFIVYENGKSKEFGFVQYVLQEDAAKAISELPNRLFLNKKLRLEAALKKQQNKPEKKQKLKNVQLTQPVVIIRNLPFACKQEDVANHFNTVGKVINVRMPLKNGSCRGFAFVELSSLDEAEKAVNELNESQLLDRTVAVDYSLPKDKYDALQSENEKAIQREMESQEKSNKVEQDTNDKVEEENELQEQESANKQEDEETYKIQEPVKESKDESSAKQDLSSTGKDTIFIRNLAFHATQQELQQRFSVFGPIKFVRITLDPVTKSSRGTAFVCFCNAEDAEKCLQDYEQSRFNSDSVVSVEIPESSILKPEPSLASSQTCYVLHDRFMYLSACVPKEKAQQLSQQSRIKNKADKRNLYLIKEGVIFPNTPAAEGLLPTELSKRQQSYNERKRLLAANTNLFISKNRLSIRNLDKKITAQQLRSLVKFAVHRFWMEVEVGRRESLEKDLVEDEIEQGFGEPRLGRSIIIEQVKIMTDSTKLDANGKPKSKGFGFVHFKSHADALSCLRYLNNNPNAIKRCLAREKLKESKEKKSLRALEEEEDQVEINLGKVRPIVEFSVENHSILKKREQRLQDKEKQDNEKKMEKSDGKQKEMNKKTIQAQCQQEKSSK